VEANKAALHWGRMWVVDPEQVRQASRTVTDLLPTPSPALEKAIVAAGLGEGELGRLVRLRAGDLAQYQNERYARRYLDTVKVAAQTGQTAFAEAVARYLYKLMAYKDEYEVARLHLDPRFERAIEDQFPEGGRIAYRLHPPMLRALGVDRKLELGEWFRPAFAALYRMRRLRGTPLDPFGHAEVRRVERRLIDDYATRVRKAVERLTPATYDQAVALAEMPDMIRGYEQIKLDSVERYYAALASLDQANAIPDAAAGD
jgi:indolepyruvate ferredoxin oxidoreductase